MSVPRIATVTLNAAIDKRYVVQGLAVPGVNRVHHCVATAGGKGLNVARVAAIAGARVTATGFLGGHAGAFIADRVRQQGITARFIAVPGESRTCINIQDEASGQVTELLEPGCGVGNTEVLQLLELVERLVKSVDVLTLSGSAPQGAPEDIYAQLIRIAHDAGRQVILDTSSPWLIPGLSARPTLVKPNQDELRQLAQAGLGDAADPQRIAQHVVAGGVRAVVLSQGGDGATLVTSNTSISLRPPQVSVANTVGCGDAMVAGLALGLALGREPFELLRHAVAISAAAAADPGTGSYDPRVAAELLGHID